MYGRDDVVNSMEKAVAEYGEEWIDPNATKGGRPASVDGCSNTYELEDGTTRHCLAAYILFDLTDVDPETVPDVAIPELIFDDFEGQFTKEAGSLLTTAQLLQDRGTPWGAILHTAEMRGI